MRRLFDWVLNIFGLRFTPMCIFCGADMWPDHWCIQARIFAAQAVIAIEALQRANARELLPTTDRREEPEHKNFELQIVIDAVNLSPESDIEQARRTR